MPNLVQRLTQRILGLPEPNTALGLAAPKNDRRQSLRASLDRIYRYRVDSTLDTRRLAIDSAENPLRPDRRILYALYKNVMDDEHLSSVWDTLVLSVTGEPVVMRTAAGRIDEGEDMIRLFQKPWFWRWIRLALEAQLWGHSLIEVLPINKDGEVEDCELIPREHVKPEWGMVLISTTDSTGPKWEDVAQSARLVSVGDRDSLGLLRKLSRAVILKNHSLSDWSRRNERFGMPFTGLKTPSRDKKELDQKADMLTRLGSNGWAIMDIEDELTFHESSQAFAFQTYEKKVALMDGYISKLILGQTMSSDDGSSLAQAAVHKEVMDERKKAWMTWLQAEINMKLIPVLVRMGYPLKGQTLEFWHLTSEYYEEQEAKAAAATKPAAPLIGKKP
jgi:hypothetical protein